MKTIAALSALLCSTLTLVADHPIPANSKSPWDYRGEPGVITRDSYAALYGCRTYEELVGKLEIAIKDLEHEPDCAAPLYVASGCRLARIRALYIMGETEKADRFLERYAAVYRREDGTPDFGEGPRVNPEIQQDGKIEPAAGPELKPEGRAMPEP